MGDSKQIRMNDDDPEQPGPQDIAARKAIVNLFIEVQRRFKNFPEKRERFINAVIDGKSGKIAAIEFILKVAHALWHEWDLTLKLNPILPAGYELACRIEYNVGWVKGYKFEGTFYPLVLENDTSGVGTGTRVLQGSTSKRIDRSVSDGEKVTVVEDKARTESRQVFAAGKACEPSHDSGKPSEGNPGNSSKTNLRVSSTVEPEKRVQSWTDTYVARPSNGAFAKGYTIGGNATVSTTFTLNAVAQNADKGQASELKETVSPNQAEISKVKTDDDSLVNKNVEKEAPDVRGKQGSTAATCGNTVTGEHDTGDCSRTGNPQCLSPKVAETVPDESVPSTATKRKRKGSGKNLQGRKKRLRRSSGADEERSVVQASASNESGNVDAKSNGMEMQQKDKNFPGKKATRRKSRS